MYKLAGLILLVHTAVTYIPLYRCQRRKYTRAKGKTAPKKYNFAPDITRRGAKNAPIISSNNNDNLMNLSKNIVAQWSPTRRSPSLHSRSQNSLDSLAVVAPQISCCVGCLFFTCSVCPLLALNFLVYLLQFLQEQVGSCTKLNDRTLRYEDANLSVCR